MRIREIPIQTRSVAGNFFSYKNKRVVKFESQLEKKCFLFLEFDKSIQSYIEQPLNIGRYVPDVLAKRNNNKNLLIEVKYYDEVEKMDERLERKINTLQEYCDKNNLEFKFFTEKDIEEPYFSNISFIYNYAGITLSEDEKKKIISYIQKYNGVSLNKLAKEGFNMAFIYKMIFDEILDINLFKKLSTDSIVRINYDRT
ncbi:TnsA endonuclease N-terminal domain-containing protein [Nitrosophilus labii]|uniref:TnsA endonuclease N-terminal domain-containing protein n=1 Tax=Nitrosophilus labii TaxID=2706014 RepID=UPI001657210A|nr:TnsA endonuclease N-terminal domain-containing protein [Nitrosophilus labii]